MMSFPRICAPSRSLPARTCRRFARRRCGASDVAGTAARRRWPLASRRVVKPRPVYLDLLHIRQPLPAIVSILHRISGALLFLVGIPLLLWALAARASRRREVFGGAARRAWRIRSSSSSLLGLVWAYLHHFCAGIRYLLLDLHIGDELKPARQSSVVVLVVEPRC